MSLVEQQQDISSFPSDSNKDKNKIKIETETKESSIQTNVSSIPSINLPMAEPETVIPAVNKSTDNIEFLQCIIESYQKLSDEIKENKINIKVLQSDAANIKAEKIDIENQLDSIDDSNDSITKKEIESIDKVKFNEEIIDNKTNIENKTCVNVINRVENIQKNIRTDTKKAESYIKPLNLSCKLLEKHITYTRILEKTVDIFDSQKTLRGKQEEADDIIKMLVDHLNIEANK